MGAKMIRFFFFYVYIYKKKFKLFSIFPKRKIKTFLKNLVGAKAPFVSQVAPPLSLTLRLFRCKIFSNVKYITLKIFSIKYFHFTVFGSICDNVQEIIL